MAAGDITHQPAAFDRSLKLPGQSSDGETGGRRHLLPPGVQFALG